MFTTQPAGPQVVLVVMLPLNEAGQVAAGAPVQAGNRVSTPASVWASSTRSPGSMLPLLFRSAQSMFADVGPPQTTAEGLTSRFSSTEPSVAVTEPSLLMSRQLAGCACAVPTAAAITAPASSDVLHVCRMSLSLSIVPSTELLRMWHRYEPRAGRFSAMSPPVAGSVPRARSGRGDDHALRQHHYTAAMTRLVAGRGRFGNIARYSRTTRIDYGFPYGRSMTNP